MGRFAVLATLLASLAAAGSAVPASQGDPFFVGFSEDLPKELESLAVAPATGLGASAFRLTTSWSPGQTTLQPAEATKLDRAVAAATGHRIVLAIFGSAGSTAPLDVSARETYCSYVRTVLRRYASIRDVVVWNEPNKSLFWSPQAGAAAAYEALLARCYDMLHAAFGSVNVIGFALSSTGNDNAGSTSPGAFIRGVGDAFRASGRTRPLFDTLGHHPYALDAGERPWRRHIQSKVIAQGDWNKLMYNLHLAFGGTAQPLPGVAGVRIWYTEAGFQTAVDAAKAGLYSGAENVETVPDFAGSEPESPAPGETSAAPDQWTQALDAIRLAACQPFVEAFFNFLLADEPRLAGWQSGAYWADLQPKDSQPAFKQAIGEASGGTVACDTLKGGRPSADFLPPSVPTDLSATPLADPVRVEVRWAPAADDQSTLSYRIYRNGAHVGTAAEMTWTNAAVGSGATYTYTVRALDAAGNLGEESAPVSVTVPEPQPPQPQPEPVPEPPAPVEAQPNPSGATEPTATQPTPVPEPASVPVPAATSPAAPAPDRVGPTAPGRLRARALRAPRRVSLSWRPARNDRAVVAYRVYRNGLLRAVVRGIVYVDRSVVAGRRYRYVVRAYDAAGNRSGAALARVTVPR